MSDIRRPKRCGLFKPGHNPHWIQLSRASEDQDNPPVPVRLLDTRSDGTFLIEIEQKEQWFWNHDLVRLNEAMTRANRALYYQASWGLLWVPGGGGRYAFCPAKNGEPVECPTELPTGTPAELLRRAGGFTVAASDVTSFIERGRTP